MSLKPFSQDKCIHKCIPVSLMQWNDEGMKNVRHLDDYILYQLNPCPYLVDTALGKTKQPPQIYLLKTLK